MASPLEDEIRRRIASTGAISVSDYMALCLAHPQHGYYATRDPFGQAGDFTTAPEISQMFGELIGAWSAAVWYGMGQAPTIQIVELGPGRGTMMADALRAATVLPAFERAIDVHFVETSPTLRVRQSDTLQDRGKTPTWHDSLASVPHAPAIILANEFFDALPVHQAVRTDDGWHERVVTIGDDGRLQFGAGESAPALFIPASVRDAPPGSIIEWRDQQITRELAERAENGSVVLIIDYGHTRSAVGDTFQAVRGHAYHDPLVAPGTADLSAHVDFQALAAAAAGSGAAIHGPVEMGPFLNRLGLSHRAAALKAQATPAQAQDIEAAFDRLTAMTPAGMGKLFKVLGFAAPSFGLLPGFDG